VKRWKQDLGDTSNKEFKSYLRFIIDSLLVVLSGLSIAFSSISYHSILVENGKVDTANQRSKPNKRRVIDGSMASIAVDILLFALDIIQLGLDFFNDKEEKNARGRQEEENTLDIGMNHIASQPTTAADTELPRPPSSEPQPPNAESPSSTLS
jgi:hypothetical protein